MNNNIIKKCCIDSLVATVGIIGIVSIIITGLGLDIDRGLVYIVGGVMAVLFTITFSNAKASAWVGIPLTLGFLIFSIINFDTFISGIRIIAYKFIKIAHEKGSIDFEVEQHLVYDEQMCLTITLIMLMIVIGIMVTLVLGFNGGMLGAALTCVPFLALFVTYIVVPSSFSFIMCVGYIFASAAGSKNSQTFASQIAALMMTAVAAIIIGVIVPESSYKWPESFAVIRGDIEEFAKSRWGLNLSGESDVGEGGFSDGTAKAGLGNGKLGDVDSVTFSHNIVGMFYTMDTDSNQYIRMYTAKDYSNNSWNLTDEMQEQISSHMVVQKFSVANKDNSLASRIKSFTSVFYSDNGTSVYNEQVIISDGSLEDYAQIGKASDASDAQSLYDLMRRRYTNVDPAIVLTVQNKFGKRYIDSDKERFDFARMVVAQLKDELRYTTSPGRVPEGRELVDYFLNDSKQGYCTYFATATTLILRTYGIPARYVSGYMVGSADVKNASISDGVKVKDSNRISINDTKAVEVKDDYAHAWCEMFIEGYGWVVVDSTPGYESSAPDYTQNEQTEKEVDEDETAVEEIEDDNSQVKPDELAANNGYAIPSWGWWIAVAVIAVALIIIIVKCYIYNITRRIKSMQGDSKAKVVNCIRMIETMLKILGYKRLDNEDELEFAKRIELDDDFIKDYKLSKAMEIGMKAAFSNTRISRDERERVQRTTIKLRRYATRKHRYAYLIPMK